jgi:hypothetical protein
MMKPAPRESKRGFSDMVVGPGEAGLGAGGTNEVFCDEQRRAGLGAAFTTAVQRTLNQIAAHPDFYPQVYQDVREALVSG